MSTVIVLVLLVALLFCLAVVVGRVIATPDPWDGPDQESEAVAAEILKQLRRGELTLPRRPPWHQ